MSETASRTARAQKKTGAPSPPLLLVDFMREERKASCPVCALPEAIRLQLLEAPAKKIKLEKRLKWLMCLQELGHIPSTVEIHQNDLTSHLNQRHDHAQ